MPEATIPRTTDPDQIHHLLLLIAGILKRLLQAISAIVPENLAIVLSALVQLLELGERIWGNPTDSVNEDFQQQS
jgi:hypothetical protein